jgi:hypothetical protein
MELLFVIGAIVALDVLAVARGHDSSETGALERHGRMLDAARRGDVDVFRIELARMERDVSTQRWRL